MSSGKDPSRSDEYAMPFARKIDKRRELRSGDVIVRIGYVVADDNGVRGAGYSEAQKQHEEPKHRASGNQG